MAADTAEATVEQLVQSSQDGDAQAFCMLVHRLEGAALSVAYSVTANFAAAGDVVQESFLQAWRRIGELREVERFDAWLMQIVRRRAIDHCRGNVRERGHSSLDSIEPPAGTDLHLEQREMREHIELAMQQLDELSRHALAMRYFEGRSSRDIAIALKLSPAAVDMRLMRARDQLRTLLSDVAVR